MINIAYCKSWKETAASTVTLDSFVKALQTGSDKTVVSTIEKIRSLRTVEDKAKINQLKDTLPGALFGGTFTSRAKDNLIQASGLMTLDFDDHGEIPKELDKYTLLRFKSPQGGNREKIIVRIPVVKNNEEYAAYFNGMADYIFDLCEPKGVNATAASKDAYRKKAVSIIDLSGSDISRLCYMSYDPNLKYYPDTALIWDKKQETRIKDANTGELRPQPDKSNAYLIRRVINLIHKGTEGYRHVACRNAGNLAGGFIAGGGMNEEEIKWLAKEPIAEINNAEADGFKDDYNTFLCGIQNGKKRPLNEAHVKNIEAQAEKIVPDFIEDTTTSAFKNEMREVRKTRHIRGASTGWTELDNYYSILEGTSTIIYSPPHVGKTTFILNMMVNVCNLHGWKGIIFSPESGSTAEILTMLIEIFLGKDAELAREDEYEYAMEWAIANFRVLNPDKARFVPSVDDLLSMSEKIIAEDKSFKVLLIDTIGDTNVDFAEDRTDKNYIKMMIALRQWFVNNNAHVFLTSHTIGIKSIAIDKTTGHQVFPIPHESQIKGGQALSQKGFNIIALYQYHPATQSDNPDEEFLFHGKQFFKYSLYAFIQKVKPYRVGRRGAVHFLNNRITHRITEYSNPEPAMFVAKDFTESKAAAQQELIYNQPEPEWMK